MENSQQVSPCFVLVPLTNGGFTKVDAADFDSVSRFNWHSTGRGYIERNLPRLNGIQKKQMMHRLLMDDPVGLEVDHINHDKSDNRRCNLRIATRQQNSFNHPGQSNSLSGIKGARWNRCKRKWQSSIKVNGESIHLGWFDCPVLAAGIYRTAELHFFGDFARKNFSETGDTIGHFPQKSVEHAVT